MKRMACIGLIVAASCGWCVTRASAQSLGDYARNVRKEKGQKAPTAPKQFDNDNLPKTDHLSVVGTPEPEAKPNDEADEGAADAAAKPNRAAAPAKEGDRAKQNREWQQKIKDQKAKVDLLSRELDVMQREYKLRAATFYADAGNRLRNQADWDKEDANYKQKIADKEAAVTEAKDKLNDLQEQARKAGVPSGMRE